MKLDIQRNLCSLAVFTCALLIFNQATFAQNRVAVVPLFTSKKIHNVIRVAKRGGDFVDPVSAVASITDASSSNRYLVFVGPGNYEGSSLIMKPYVHIQGAGRGVTVITARVSDDSFPPALGTVVLANHTNLSALTVRNTSTTGTAIALLAPPGVTQTVVANVSAEAIGSADKNYGVHVMGIGGAIVLTLENVNGLAENGATSNYGLRNYYQSTLTLRGGTYTGRGGETAYGVSNGADDTSLLAENIFALAENATVNYGLTNGEAIVSLLGGSFTAQNGTQACAIYNYTRSELEAQGVTALAKGATYNRGIENAMADATLNGGFYTAKGGDDARALYNRLFNGDLYATAVTALAKDATSYNYGLYNADEAEAKLEGGSYTGEGGTSTRGIYNLDAYSRLKAHNVSAIGREGSVNNSGLYNSTDAKALLYGGSFIAQSANGGSGIQNYAATLEANHVYALGEGGGSYTQGLLSTSGAVAVLQGGSFVARDASFEARGIFTWGGGSSLIASGATIRAENGAENYGIVMQTDVTADITQCTLAGSNNSVYRNATAGAVAVSNSRLIGGDVFGTVTCVAVTHGTTFYETTCP